MIKHLVFVQLDYAVLCFLFFNGINHDWHCLKCAALYGPNTSAVQKKLSFQYGLLDTSNTLKGE
jgi:hypothetical protein